ncbi:hypothetical protein ID866_4061, partial [Astraeus odoratus]
MLPVSENTSLLANGESFPDSYPRRILRILKAEGEPSWFDSFKFFIFGSWVNILLLFVPLSAVSHHLDWDAALRFAFSFMAIIPLAKVPLPPPSPSYTHWPLELLGEATDQMSVRLGQTLSGLLNASFGNAVEIIIGIAALLNGELRIVQTSLRTHPYLFRQSPEDGDEEETEPHMSTAAAAVSLLLVTVITAFCAEYLVASIEETAQRYNISMAFIGVVLLPIVGNAAEHVTSVWMATKNKYELTIGICVGSSIVIVPLLVIVGWIVGQPLTLHFKNFETIMLFVSVLLVSLLLMDGKTNYMEGLMLTTLYLVIAIACKLTLVDCARYLLTSLDSL